MGHRRGPGGGMFADKSRTRGTRQLLGIFWKFLESDKNKLVGITFIIIAYTLASIFQPIIIQQAIDRAIATLSEADILTLISLYLGLSLLVWVFQSMNTWVTAILSTSMVDRIRKRAFAQLVDADMRYHHLNQSGEVTSRVINDSQEIATGLSVFTTTSAQLLLVVGTLIVLFSISYTFALVSLLAVPVAFLITRFISTIGKKRMLQVRQAYGKTSGKLAENLAGVMIAKSFNQEGRTSNEIRKLNFETYGYMKQLGLIFMIIMPTISAISVILIYLVMVLGGFISQTDPGMTVGLIYLGTTMVTRFLMPIIQLANSFTQLQASLAALDRIVDVIEQQPEVQNAPEATPILINGAEVEFSSVNFAYSLEQTKKMKEKEMQAKGMGAGMMKMEAGAKPNPEMMQKMKKKGKPSPEMMKMMKDQELKVDEKEEPTLVLDNVSFKIPAGEKWAVVGHTGAGKTTLTNLIMRFYDPISGSVTIDGQDLKKVTIESLYDNISLVSQEPYLFASTIMENIRYGKPDATDGEILEISQLIGADRFIKALPDGYETMLSESGKSLSAGQRQMITIARTMLSDPKLLILDEATSRLDALTESLVQIAQNKLFEGRTTLVIAHRLSTIRDVDKIIAMENGKIIEIGNHDELIKNKSVYAKLYNMYYRHQGLEVIAD